MALGNDMTRNNIQEFISKIDTVSNEEFGHMITEIHDVLRADNEGKSQNVLMCISI